MSYYNKELFEVCREGDKERLKKLIGEGVDINYVDEFGKNCLFYACYYGNEEIVKLLIKEGINIQQVDEFGKNCLFYTCYHKYKEIIEILIKERIDIQDKIYKSKIIEDDIKDYVKELEIKREIREKYI